MRVLLVGGVKARRHAGPVDWAGHRFEMIPHQFDRCADLRLGDPGSRLALRSDAVDALVAAVEPHDAILCEIPEAVLLAVEWERRGRPPRAVVALEVHALRRVEALRAYFRDQGAGDPWPRLCRSTWLQLIAASRAQAATLVAAGVPGRRVHFIQGNTAALRMLVPDVDAVLDGPRPDPPLLPPDAVLFAGSGQRDLLTTLRAAQALPGLPCFVLDDSRAVSELGRRAPDLVGLPNVTWLPPTPLEGFVEIVRSAAVLGVCVQAGPGDGGHMTVAIAHRAGVPVVATDTPGLTDYLASGRAARTVPPGDPLAFAAAVREVLGETRLRDRLVATGRRIELRRAGRCERALLRALAAAAAGAQRVRA